MKRILYLTCLLMLCPVLSSGQTNDNSASVCTSETINKISVRGVRIGQTLEQIEEKFPYLITDEQATNEIKRGRTTNFGNFSLYVRPPQDDPQYTRVGGYRLEFLDNKLVSMGVSYYGVTWDNVNQFIEKLSKAFNLPAPSYWDLRGSSEVLKCGDYIVLNSIMKSLPLLVFKTERASFPAFGFSLTWSMVNDTSCQILEGRREFWHRDNADEGVAD